MSRAKKVAGIPPELLAALAPAGTHLLAAAVELVAAASAAIDALSDERAAGPLPKKAVEALAQARASLTLFASLAQTGAASARAKARDAAKREALAEILGALEARADSMQGAARETLLSVRDAVASATGASRSREPEREKRARRGRAASGSRGARHERVKKKSRNLRRIPIVLDRDSSEE
ncbi:MAG TPA: hypothetical protein VMV18_13200 [bacterium]|nr:hypothetical protein [bacterium]